MEKFILGLDMGTNSIGSAIVRCDDNKNPIGLIALHNRIFQEMVEADTRVPKNKKRREKRGARKLVRRYKLRRTNLIQLLVKNGMLPENMPEKGREMVFNSMGDPFSLRAKGLDEPITPHQFGRVLMHLLKRRGYRSNRGAKYIDLMKHPKVVDLHKSELQDNGEGEGENKEKIDERKIVLAGISQLHKAIEESNSRTLGEFIFKASPMRHHRDGEEQREPRRITKLKFNGIILFADRKLYEDEFNALWSKQKEFLSLTDGLKAQIYDAIFAQRPMKIQKNLVGKCSFEIRKPRAAKAMLESQEFRMLQEINDMRIELPREQSKPLAPEWRQILVNALNNPYKLNDKGQLTWAVVKEELRIDKRAKFNLQETSKNGLSDNRTNLALSKIIPEHWKNFSIQQKQALVTDLLTIHDKKALFSRLINEFNLERNPWKFSNEEAYTLATLELEPGYAKHCLKVIRKLLPFMRNGMNYHDACQEAGYLRKDQIAVKQQASLPTPPNVANPIVQKALFEARRVVNAILKTYGMPQIIRIELAREIKASKDHRKIIQEQQRKNQERNEDAEKEIKQWAKTHPEYGITLDNQNYVSREDILKYKLWDELGGDRLCPYCNSTTPISQAMLFSGEVEIDHIFPLSRSHDDSYLNKVLCHASCNQGKGQRTPYEAWGGTMKYSEILNRLGKLEKQKICNPRKLAKIKETKFEGEGFVAAQLNDTRYISVAVKNYLEQLGIPVQVSTGKATATVRRFLGLNNILPKKSDVLKSAAKSIDADSEGNNEEDDNGHDKKFKIKKERDDHRHHAIDAFVTALTDKRLLDEITKRYQYFEKTGKWPDEKLEKICYWNNLRDDVKDILMQSVVSFAVNHKISGELHAEMPFGVSYYLEDKEVKKLKENDILTDTESPNAESWIFEKDARDLVRSWWETNKKLSKKDKNPLYLKSHGTTLEKVKIAHRCYVKRKPVKDALKYIANEPGKKTWIVDKGIRNVLVEWLKSNKPAEAEKNPPLLLNKKNPEKSNSIKTVRVATKFSPSSIRCIGKGQTQFFELRSNHHVVIFKHKETGERKGRVVSMIEAASRVIKPPIIKTAYPEFNPQEWEFEMFLCNNDMVLWDNDDPEWKEKGHESLGLPIYRVQKLIQDGRIIFRHHSSVTAKTDNRGVISKSISTLRCKKITTNTLGKYTTDQ